MKTDNFFPRRLGWDTNFNKPAIITMIASLMILVFMVGIYQHLLHTERVIAAAREAADDAKSAADDAKSAAEEAKESADDAKQAVESHY